MFGTLLGIDFLLVVTKAYKVQDTSNVKIWHLSKADIAARTARAFKYIEVANVSGLTLTFLIP
jgi:hypothetical protein